MFTGTVGRYDKMHRNHGVLNTTPLMPFCPARSEEQELTLLESASLWKKAIQNRPIVQFVGITLFSLVLLFLLLDAAAVQRGFVEPYRHL